MRAERKKLAKVKDPQYSGTMVRLKCACCQKQFWRQRKRRHQIYCCQSCASKSQPRYRKPHA